MEVAVTVMMKTVVAAPVVPMKYILLLTCLMPPVRVVICSLQMH